MEGAEIATLLRLTIEEEHRGMGLEDTYGGVMGKRILEFALVAFAISFCCAPAGAEVGWYHTQKG